MADFTRLVYDFNEVIADFSGTGPTTRLIYQFNEVIADPAFGAAQTRLRYQFVEVIASAPGVGGAAYTPVIMACT